MKSFRAYADLWRDVKFAYVQVRVFDTRKQMAKDINTAHFGPADGTHAQCSGLAHYNRSGRMTGRFALMWFNKQDLALRAAEIVSHECVHAGMRHMANKRINVHQGGQHGGGVGANEEALAYTVGCLTQQINDRLHKLGAFDA